VTAPALAVGVAALGGLLAGAVNAVAGGGTIISFPALQAIGVPSVRASITNIVALTPGYLAGAHAQRADLAGQHGRLRALAAVSAVGGLAGSILLVVVSAATFRTVVPYLILLACATLLAQDRLRRMVARAGSAAPPDEAAEHRPGAAELAAVLLCSVYGGFFGAGLGIMLLAVIGLFSDAGFVRSNALKQALSLIVNAIAALFLVFSGKVEWVYAVVMAATSTLGGALGGRYVQVIDPRVLRAGVVVLGCVVAIRYWV
jgi:uncharacterized membrane protein YfcA